MTITAPTIKASSEGDRRFPVAGEQSGEAANETPILERGHDWRCRPPGKDGEVQRLDPSTPAAGTYKRERIDLLYLYHVRILYPNRSFEVVGMGMTESHAASKAIEANLDDWHWLGYPTNIEFRQIIHSQGSVILGATYGSYICRMWMRSLLESARNTFHSQQRQMMNYYRCPIQRVYTCGTAGPICNGELHRDELAEPRNAKTVCNRHGDIHRELLDYAKTGIRPRVKEDVPLRRRIAEWYGV